MYAISNTIFKKVCLVLPNDMKENKTRHTYFYTI